MLFFLPFLFPLLSVIFFNFSMLFYVINTYQSIIVFLMCEYMRNIISHIQMLIYLNATNFTLTKL